MVYKHADESLKIKTKHPIQGVRVNQRNKKKEKEKEKMKKYNVIHVSTYSGKETIIRKNVSLYEANEAFYGINNTYIIEVVDE